VFILPLFIFVSLAQNSKVISSPQVGTLLYIIAQQKNWLKIILASWMALLGVTTVQTFTKALDPEPVLVDILGGLYRAR